MELTATVSRSIERRSFYEADSREIATQVG